jgi:hypothetical protein
MIAFPPYISPKIVLMHVKETCETNLQYFFKRSNRNIGTNVKVRVFNIGLLAGCQFASGRSCDRPNRSRLSVVFPRIKTSLMVILNYVYFA